MSCAVTRLQASMPPCSTMLAAWSRISIVRGCSSPESWCRKNGIGTPQLRWREMHQSGRLAIMSCSRGLAVLGVEAGVLYGLERDLAQCLVGLVLGEHALAFVHAHKPLRCGAVDHGRLVAPAMRVAVADVAGGQQAAGAAQRLDDQRHG